MPEPIVRAERFSYSYPDRHRPALRELSLAVQPGELVVVCGESGSGKSTLLRAVAGLVPHFHGGDAEGELTVGGLSLRRHGPGELAAVCGTLLQDPESQVVMSGVHAEIALPLEHRGEGPAAVARAVEEAALALGVERLLGRRAETLSGGELQRVALAAALATRPPLLVLDEPASQLDPVAGDELVSLLRRLNEDQGVTVLLAEHRLERSLAAADRVVALEDGALACDAEPADFLRWASERCPELLPPAARLFSLAGLAPLPASVKDARAALAGARLAPKEATAATGGEAASNGDGSTPEGNRSERAAPRARSALRRLAGRRDPRPSPALELEDVWHEIEDGPAILRGVDLRVEPGERIALMGRNGAGKSTLLRHARGLAEPTRGAVRRAGEVALLMQSPGDYLIHERCDREVGPAGLAAAGLAARAASDPRDLSGGERQRLALEVVLERPQGSAPPAALCLDEPTRGMDAMRRRALVARLDAVAEGGTAVVVATHDTGFAAEVADRVVLMGQGVVVADGPVSEVLSGGWRFATEVARVLGGAGGALTPEEGSRLIERELIG